MILSHVDNVFSTSCILGRAPHTKETLPDFSLNHGSEKGDMIRAIYFLNKVLRTIISHIIFFFFTSLVTGQLCLFPLFP